jgi:hypothetical protein
MTGQAGFRGEKAKAKSERDGRAEHDFSAVMQRGLKAVALGQSHLAAREPRLPAGMLDGLTGDLQQLGVDVGGALVIRSSASTAMKSQYGAPARGGLVVTAIRTSGLRRRAAVDVRAACGVGARGRNGRGSGVARAGYWEYERSLFAGIMESGRSVVTGFMESGREGELDRDVGRAGVPARWVRPMKRRLTQRRSSRGLTGRRSKKVLHLDRDAAMLLRLPMMPSCLALPWLRPKEAPGKKACTGGDPVRN